jgi:hypothetical protein
LISDASYSPPTTHDHGEPARRLYELFPDGANAPGSWAWMRPGFAISGQLTASTTRRLQILWRFHAWPVTYASRPAAERRREARDDAQDDAHGRQYPFCHNAPLRQNGAGLQRGYFGALFAPKYPRQSQVITGCILPLLNVVNAGQYDRFGGTRHAQRPPTYSQAAPYGLELAALANRGRDRGADDEAGADHGRRSRRWATGRSRDGGRIRRRDGG